MESLIDILNLASSNKVLYIYINAVKRLIASKIKVFVYIVYVH